MSERRGDHSLTFAATDGVTGEYAFAWAEHAAGELGVRPHFTGRDRDFEMLNIFNRGGLPRKVTAEIERLSEQGNAQLESDDLQGAYESFIQALELLPEPRHKWKEATWLFAALGDVYFLSDSFSQALQAFTDAICGPDAVGNPFLHLRLGQCQFEAGNHDRAADELARAYMGGGSAIFEEDDPKYFAFLKTRLQPPDGGW